MCTRVTSKCASQAELNPIKFRPARRVAVGAGPGSLKGSGPVAEFLHAEGKPGSPSVRLFLAQRETCEVRVGRASDPGTKKVLHDLLTRENCPHRNLEALGKDQSDEADRTWRAGGCGRQGESREA